MISPQRRRGSGYGLREKKTRNPQLATRNFIFCVLCVSAVN